MIRLSRMADYAVVTLSQMARAPDAVHTAAELAARTGLGEPTVAKLMQALARGGVLRSRRGVDGGYALARAPEEISVADIISSVDGPIALTACVDGASGACHVEGVCATRGAWDRVNEAIRGALEAISLSDMRAAQARAFPIDFREPAPACNEERR